MQVCALGDLGPESASVSSLCDEGMRLRMDAMMFSRSLEKYKSLGIDGLRVKDNIK
jgi:hypothetical protein